MDKILGAKFGEATSTVRAAYKKTVKIREYETEVTELESTLDIDTPLDGWDRIVLNGVMMAQLEYSAYVMLLSKKQITQETLIQKKQELQDGVNSLIAKAEQMTGRSMDKYF